MRLAAAAAADLGCVVLQAGATAMFMIASAIASGNGCNTIFVTCRWVYFVQWTCWNTVSTHPPILSCICSHMGGGACIGPQGRGGGGLLGSRMCHTEADTLPIQQ